MSVTVNTLFLLAVLPWSRGAPWSWGALIAFILAGVGTTWLGRATALRAIRLIGPARQGAFLITAPVFTGLAGWALLGESLTIVQMVGGVLVLSGLATLVRSRMVAEPLEADAPEAIATIRQRGERRSIARAALSTVSARGYGIAFVSAVSFGLGYVGRKWGLTHYPNAVFGALVGALMSLSLIVVRESMRKRMHILINANIRDIPKWFVAAGVLSGFGLLMGFSAFIHLPAWAVAVVKGTQGLWALFWSYLFIREEEHLGWNVFAAVILTFAGVCVIAVAS